MRRLLLCFALLVPAICRADPRLETAGSFSTSILSSRHPFFTGPGYFDFEDHVYNWLESVLKLQGSWNISTAVSLTAGGTGATTLDTDYYKRDDDLLGVIDPLRLDVRTSSFSATLGRQDVRIGDGFLVGDGYNDDAAARYSIPLKYWDGLTARGALGRWSALGMAANLSGSYSRRRDSDPVVPAQGQIYALDLAHAWSERTMLGATGFARQDDGESDQDLRIASGRGALALGRFDLGGEYAHQGGAVRSQHTDAFGYHTDIAYRFPGDASLRAMYARFSGDNPATPDDEAFHDWHYGGEDWNRWYLGNNVGSTLLFNENERAYALEGSFEPSPKWTAHLILERFERDRLPSLAPPGTSRYFATESDFVLEFDAGGGWSFWLLESGTLPGPRARLILPNDRITTETFVNATYEF